MGARHAEEAQPMTFLIIMAAGIIGLLLMALPGLSHHSHFSGAPRIAPHAHGGIHLPHAGRAHGAGQALGGLRGGHAAPPVHAGGHAPSTAAQQGGQAPATALANQTGGQGAAQSGSFEWARVIPSPRAVFSIMALFGAFGYALLPLVHFWPLAAALALVPAWAIEYFAVRPLWNALFQFQGRPTAPIEALVTCDATAVTPFRNGKGLVSVEHNGQIVQFSARLQESHASVPVRVGDKLCVEEVDPANQRILVSVK